MNKEITFIVIVILVGIISFYFGYRMPGKDVLNLELYELNQQVEVQVSPKNLGQIPAGTNLYKFRQLPETTTYVIFVNLKERTVVNEKGNAEGVMMPLDAYLK